MAIVTSHAEKLLKLLSLTRSENDHEALSAIRTTNKIMAAHGYDWELFLTGGQASSSPSPSPAKPPRPSPEVDLEAVMANPLAFIDAVLAKPKFANRKGGDFLRSLADYFAKHGCLTERQSEWVLKLYVEAFGGEPKRAASHRR